MLRETNKFFAIWTVIYTLLVGMTIYNYLYNVWNWDVHTHLITTFLLNLTWIVVFGIGNLLTCFIGFLIIIAMIFSGISGWIAMGDIPDSEYDFTVVLFRNFLIFYVGWILAAVNLNLGIVLRYCIGVSDKVQVIVFWALVPITYIAFVTLVWKNFGSKGL